MEFLTYVNVDSANPNSSPTYIAPPVIYLPTNNVWQYNPLPFDPDGDSLVWNLSVPLSNNTTVAGYQYLSDTVLYSVFDKSNFILFINASINSFGISYWCTVF